MVHIDTLKMAAPEGYFKKEVQEKRKIVLHFTAGYTASACYGAFRAHKNGTAFIIDRNGEVYQYFDPRYWASHIYRHKKGEDARFYQHEKESIGIEIANIGPLTLDAEKQTLMTYLGREWCTLEQKSLYVQKDHRGRSYYATFTEGQYASLANLLDLLCQDFGITRDSFVRYQHIWLDKWDVDFITQYNGITNHGNYRSDKYDIGPGFNFERLIGG